MKRILSALALTGSWMLAGAALAHSPAAVSIEIVGPDGRTFREFPVRAPFSAWR